jgi:hypothetical protein
MPSDRTEAKKNWLDMHDSIQDELLRLKKEMVASKEDILTEVKRSAYPDQTQGAMEAQAADPYVPAAPATAPLRIEEAAKAVEVPEEQDPKRPDTAPSAKAPTEPTPQVKERSIREMISTSDVVKEGGSDAEAQSALPKHPELTSYIAKVMQHESKIKRKKFERERSTRPQKGDVPSKDTTEALPMTSDLPVSNPPPIESPPAPPAEPVPEEVVPDEAPPSDTAEKGPEPAPEAPPTEADPDPEATTGSDAGPEEPQEQVPDEAPRRRKKHKNASESEERASETSKKGLMSRIRQFLTGG